MWIFMRIPRASACGLIWTNSTVYLSLASWYEWTYLLWSVGNVCSGWNLRPGMFTLGRASQALRHRTKINAQGMRENMLVGVGVELVWLMVSVVWSNVARHAVTLTLCSFKYLSLIMHRTILLSLNYGSALSSTEEAISLSYNFGFFLTILNWYVRIRTLPLAILRTKELRDIIS